MKKILFVIGSLQVGGAETVMVDIINNIYKDFDITLLLVEKNGELLDRLTDNVKLKYLTLGDKYCNNIFSKIYNKIKKSLIYRYFGKNKNYIRRIYKNILKDKYDTEIAFLAGLPAEIVKRSPDADSKKIAWIHSETTKNYDTDHLSICNGFDKIIGNCKSSIESFEKYFPECGDKLELIYNYIDINKIKDKSDEKIDIEFNKKTYNFLSLGRIVEVKGFDRILSIAKKYENKITFYIGGIGPLEEEYKLRIEKENIKNVKFIGLLKNPYPYIKNTDTFLMVSRSEAYPTVVIEAMILNKSIIATDVLGINEILDCYADKIIINNNDESIERGIDGWLMEHDNKKNIVNNNKFLKRNDDVLIKVKEMLRSDKNEK